MKKRAVLAASAVTLTALLVLPVVALSVNNGEQHAEPSQNSVVQEKNADQTADLPVCFADSAAVLNPDEKERIVDGMLNSTQYFSTVQGSFTTSLVTGDISAPSTIVYMVDIPGENVYEQLLDDQNDMEVYFAQRQQAQYMNDRKQVIISYGGAAAPADRMLRNDILQLRETAQNVGVMPDGEMCYLYPEDYSNTKFARMSICAQELTFGLLSDRTLWDVEREDTLFGRDCLVLAGTVEEAYGAGLNIHSFDMWVDQQTGILLGFHGYNAAGEKTQFLETGSFAVDAAEISLRAAGKTREADSKYADYEIINRW